MKPSRIYMFYSQAHIWIKEGEYVLGSNKDNINITLSLHNSGDLPAENITVILFTPPGVEIEKKKINIPLLNSKSTENISIKVSNISKSIMILAKLEGAEHLTGYLKEGSESYIFVKKE